mgnify:CR=1 FL=1
MPTIAIKRCHLTQKGNTKAFLSIDLNGKVVIHGCRLVEGSNGLFLSMPQTKSEKDVKWYDHVQITDQALKDLVQNTAIEHYERMVGVGAPASADEGAPF